MPDSRTHLATYRLTRTLSAEESQKLSEALLWMSAYFQLIRRCAPKSDLLSDTGRLPPILRKHLTAIRKIDEWPGTRLVGHKAISYIFESDAEIARQKIDLFFPVSFESFEDVAFFRADDSLILGSVSHESIVWLDLDESERTFLTPVIPGMMIPE
jgi:hypothetical protein